MPIRKIIFIACLGFVSMNATSNIKVSKTQGALPDSSVYQLTSTWESDVGKPIQLQSLRGKPRVMTMFFSQCESICPMLMGQLKLLEMELPKDLKQRFGFVLVTFDVERDSVESLRDYRKRLGFSLDNWKILRGNADDTRELALLLGVEFQPGGKGQIDHNGLIVLLDEEGRIVKKVSEIKDRSAFISEMQRMINPQGKF